MRSSRRLHVTTGPATFANCKTSLSDPSSYRQGATLQAPVESLCQGPRLGMASAGARTLEEAETMHIISVLKQVNWVVGGPKGAAEKLGLKRTTLIATMRRLGITRPEVRSAA